MMTTTRVLSTMQNKNIQDDEQTIQDDDQNVENHQNLMITENYNIDIPSKFIDPISLDAMQIPVLAADGKSYEAASLMRWFAEGKTTSPLDGRVKLAKNINI